MSASPCCKVFSFLTCTEKTSNKLMYNNRDYFRFFLFVSLSKFSESNDYLNHLKILELVSNESESNFDHCAGFHSFVII